MSGEELEVSVSAVVEAEEVDDPLVQVGEDELENLEPENEGVVFVITTNQSRRQSRKGNKTNPPETRVAIRSFRGKVGSSPPHALMRHPNVVNRAASENRSPKKSVSVPQRRRHLSATEREEQERIDRENRILLRKILEQHHGLRRSSSIPPSHPPPPSRRNTDADKKKFNVKAKQTSNQGPIIFDFFK